MYSNTCMTPRTIAVLRGGPSPEHDVSLRTGASVLEALRGLSGEFQHRDIFIDRGGAWHVRGVPISPERSLAGVDIVWNALHGAYGEDGTVQRLLERSGVAYTGSAVYASSVSLNKPLAKKLLAEHGIRTPYSALLDVSSTLESDMLALFRRMPQPSVVKPIHSGSSLGVSVARDFGEFRLAVRLGFEYAPKVLVEEYIQGKEITCAVLEGFRGQSLYALPPVEFLPSEKYNVMSYEEKCSGGVLRCPSSLSVQETKAVQDLAVDIHTLLGLRHYSRGDFIMSRNGTYFLETNSLPGLEPVSPFVQSLSAVGVSFPEFIRHVLALARKG